MLTVDKKMKPSRLVTLEIGRGVAALLVCMFHFGSGYGDKYFEASWSGNVFSGGRAGVQYFFVLSGFIIYWIHNSDFGRVGSLKVFLRKRFERLYPIYWFILIPILVMMFLVPSLGADKNLTLLKVICDFLLLPSEGTSVIPPTWTLHREILFYGLFAFTIFKPKVGWPLIFVWQLLCLTNGLFNFTVSDYRNWQNVIFGDQNIGFGLGMIAAFILLNYPIKKLNSLFISALGFTGFFVLIASDGYLSIMNINEYEMGISSIYTVGYLLTPFLLILGLVNLEQHVRIKIPTILTTFGGASYVMYLMHLSIGSVVYKVLSTSYLKPYFGITSAFVVATIVVVVISMIIHVVIEKRLLVLIRSIKYKSPSKSVLE
ncbi:acyltransferase family protein [Pseudoalteromonas denitrificans]|uniref:Peptidoglycan/LPS O-acetylase OafA/YrhL, contains acyltransferase and SGNH-hydrolase domains n=1 Tax=Pseudoalteromonas denitrificans DSM 6059 TaxID=1123010 RepID=A0A1I1F8D7_9GAMM|nr:acyltransferase [Pseudoalteromonas denitrificans]SFB95607.1 Peptidoglycan/LPS O-acetylase OafA/YrhL, contains acyltransferase and SGNH-hydrolase domains [Pseudoalteromonas denitrificans DSM 6059]